jgi:hypothetical protein
MSKEDKPRMALQEGSLAYHRASMYRILIGIDKQNWYIPMNVAAGKLLTELHYGRKKDLFGLQRHDAS